MQSARRYIYPHNYEKHAPRVSQVIAAVAKVSCKHGLWLVARVNKKDYVIGTSTFCLLHNPFFRVITNYLIQMYTTYTA